jgi:uncharacterized protein
VSRLLWWLILGLAAWWLIKRLRVDPSRRGTEQSAPRSDASRSTAPTRHDPVAMVRCAHCGVHLPQSEALLDDGQHSFCSAAHRGAGPR